jgi:DNA helicase IV
MKFDVFNWQSCSPGRKKKFWAMQRPMMQLIGLAKSQGYGSEVGEKTMQDLVDRHGIELPDCWCWGTFTAIMRECFARTSVIDFDDMIWFPLVKEYVFPKYDYIFVDESQDLSPAQARFVRCLASDGGRIIAVGDTHQAIYGFRGADADAMSNLKTTLNATVLPLSICYRCGKNIVECAQNLVPHIEASETAEDGLVTSIPEGVFTDHVTDADYVLCRVTAPLVQFCLDLIADGRKATVLGRDIGEMLLKTIKSLKLKDSDSNDVYIDCLNDWYSSMCSKYEHKKAALMKSMDTYDTLRAVGSGCTTVADIKTRIDTIFSKDGEGVVFSTIHKSKGLEADTIFILKPNLLPHPLASLPWQVEQESNLHYVAITRAKKKLVYVLETT